MLCLQKTRVLDFHLDTLKVVRKSYGFDKTEDMSKAVDLLEDWVKQQTHFTKKDFSREYLERCIVGNKGSIERTKEKLDKICTYRTLWPHLFTDIYLREEAKVYEDNAQIVFLPNLTKDHYRVLLIRNALKTFKPTFLIEVFRYFYEYMEYVKAHDYVHGYIVIIDYSDVNFTELLSVMTNINDLRQCFAVLLEGYEARVKGIHVWSHSKLVEMLLKIVKQFLPAKMGERINVHSKLDSIYDFVSKASLPIEYGGEEKSIKTLQEEWLDVLSSKEQVEYKREMNNARTDESLRQTNSFLDESMGISGTFRTLCVD